MMDNELREALDTIFDILGGITERLKSVESAVKGNGQLLQAVADREEVGGHEITGKEMGATGVPPQVALRAT